MVPVLPVLFLGAAFACAQNIPPIVPSDQIPASSSMSLQDSLEVNLLDIEIRKARQAIHQTNIWHRLLPRVSVTASVSAREILWVDPTTSEPAMLPRDAYRLTFTLSLSDLLDDSKHAMAELELERLEAARARLLDRQEKALRLLARRVRASEEEAGMAAEELRLTERIVNYRQLLFDQGKLQFDVLMRSRLDLINAARAVSRCALQQFSLTGEVCRQSGNASTEAGQ